MKADAKSGTFSEYVENGTYYLVITREYGAGSLTVNARATAVTTDKEYNGSMEKAASMSIGSKMDALITCNDKYDTFKFSMSSARIVMVDMTSVTSGSIEGKGNADKKVIQTFTALDSGSFTGKAGVYTVTRDLPA